MSLLDDMGLSSDAELLRRVRNGDAATYGVLYEHHLGAARCLARSLLADTSDAEDVVAEVFAATFAAMSKGRGPADDFRLYVLTSVRRECHRTWRRGGRQRPGDAATTPTTPTNPTMPTMPTTPPTLGSSTMLVSGNGGDAGVGRVGGTGGANGFASSVRRGAVLAQSSGESDLPTTGIAIAGTLVLAAALAGLGMVGRLAGHRRTATATVASGHDA